MTRFYGLSQGQVAKVLELLRKVMNEYSVLVDTAHELNSSRERPWISLRTRYGLVRTKKWVSFVINPFLVR